MAYQGPPKHETVTQGAMSAADYVSEELTQKAIRRMIKDQIEGSDYDKYIKVLVPLISKAFVTEYRTLRRPSNPGEPQKTFDTVFGRVLNRTPVEKLDGLDKGEISRVASRIMETVYPALPRDFFQPPNGPFEGKVCIVGSGAAGLYAAMILDDFGIEYEILEAADRVGGRIFTKKLESGAIAGGHDYFDVGAMRYPDIPMMKPTFDLFTKLGLMKGTDLIPYNLRGPNNPWLFNNKHSPRKPDQPVKDFFGMGEQNGGMVPDWAIEAGHEVLLKRAFKPFQDEFRKDNRKGWKKLSKYDMYSTRAYLALEMKYSPEVIEWCENMNVTAGLFDQAFSESVIRSMEFDQEDVKWWCIEGGSRVFIERMVKYIKYKPATNRRVTSIELVKGRRNTPDTMSVQVQGESGSRFYDHVISTVPLSCLRCINLSKAGLSYDQNVAIRSLGYDSSVKVGIKFRSPWWRKPLPHFPEITGGGFGLTDGIIGLCVYPSYGLNDPIDEPGVMIASYTLAQDARRMGALCQGKDTKVEARLIDLVLYDLAKLHNLKYNVLKEEMLDHYAHDWYRDENAMGAFALFGPGQFGTSYPSLLKPAGGGRLNFIGEAISVQHGWVSGSLNSAWRGIDNIFNREGYEDSRIQLRENWGTVADLSEATLNLSVLMGTREH